MQPTPVLLPGESHGQRSLVGKSVGSQRDGHDWSSLAHTRYWLFIPESWLTTKILMLNRKITCLEEHYLHGAQNSASASHSGWRSKTKKQGLFYSRKFAPGPTKQTLRRIFLEIQMADKHRKRGSTLLIIKEMQIKTTMRGGKKKTTLNYHRTPVRMAVIFFFLKRRACHS